MPDDNDALQGLGSSGADWRRRGWNHAACVRQGQMMRGEVVAARKASWCAVCLVDVVEGVALRL